MLIKLFVAAFVLTTVLIAACAKVDSPSGPSVNSTTSERQTYAAVGVVKKLDAENGKITIDHEDIPGYMAAMEMDVSVADRSLLGATKAGDKIEFELERTGENLVITKLTKIGEVAIIDGAQIYQTNCANCHGNAGEGTKTGISLVKGHALHHSETEHIKQVTDGEGDKMPAFRDKLSAEQIAEVVKFVRKNIQKDAARDNSRKHKH